MDGVSTLSSLQRLDTDRLVIGRAHIKPVPLIQKVLSETNKGSRLSGPGNPE